jgi:hypothetical protein
MVLSLYLSRQTEVTSRLPSDFVTKDSQTVSEIFSRQVAG